MKYISLALFVGATSAIRFVGDSEDIFASSIQNPSNFYQNWNNETPLPDFSKPVPTQQSQ